MATQREILTDFMSKSPGTVYSLDEIANGTGLPRKQVSVVACLAREAGLPIVNAMPGHWQWDAAPEMAVGQERREETDEQDGLEHEHHEEREPVVSIEAGHVNLDLLMLLHTGHDREGNRIVVSQRGCAYRLVEL